MHHFWRFKKSVVGHRFGIPSNCNNSSAVLGSVNYATLETDNGDYEDWKTFGAYLARAPQYCWKCLYMTFSLLMVAYRVTQLLKTCGA